MFSKNFSNKTSISENVNERTYFPSAVSIYAPEAPFMQAEKRGLDKKSRWRFKPFRSGVLNIYMSHRPQFVLEKPSSPPTSYKVNTT